MSEIIALRPVRQITAPTLFDSVRELDEVDQPDLIPPVKCEPWCADGTGHPDPLQAGAQICRSEAVRIETRDGGGSGYASAPTHHGVVVLQAQRDPGKPTRVVIGLELVGTEAWMHLTPAEAHDVGEQLLHHADLAA